MSDHSVHPLLLEAIPPSVNFRLFEQLKPYPQLQKKRRPCKGKRFRFSVSPQQTRQYLFRNNNYFGYSLSYLPFYTKTIPRLY
jgi:hypothetical protein